VFKYNRNSNVKVFPVTVDAGIPPHYHRDNPHDHHPVFLF
jgi:hypothetical protein